MLSYDRLAKGYNELHYKEQLTKVVSIIDELKIKNEKILDVGCGTALYSGLFKNYLGIDNSIEMMRNAHANIVYGEAENLPFKDNSFDIIICISAIHNFNNVRKAVEEIKRVTNGKIAITLFKRSRKFSYIKKIILKNFEVKEIDAEKDVVFVGRKL
ncbi:MAG: class I SAM-dependent methyltransferase [Nanoarchaeota archaeon]